MYIGNNTGSSATFEIYVYDDNGGSPGTLKSQGTFNCGSSSGWVTPTLSTQPVLTGDFYIFVGPQTMDGYLGLALDANLDYYDRMGAADYLPGWYSAGYYGDFVLRANVTYISVEENGCYSGVELYPISPNIVKDRVNISYALNVLKEGTSADLKIYDAGGKLVRTLESKVSKGGVRNVEWDTRNDGGNKVGSGVYFCKLSVGNLKVLTRRIIVL